MKSLRAVLFLAAAFCLFVASNARAQQSPIKLILKADATWEQIQARAKAFNDNFQNNRPETFPPGMVATAPNYYKIETEAAWDQGNCGSCAAYASLGAFQFQAKKELGALALSVDPGAYYSNVLQLPCTGDRAGYRTSQLLDDLRGSKPVVLTGIGRNRSPIVGNFRAKSWGYTRDKDAMRRILASGRPLVARFDVTPLYPLYGGGVYSEKEMLRQVQPSLPGLPQWMKDEVKRGLAKSDAAHAILVVGYVKAGTPLLEVFPELAAVPFARRAFGNIRFEKNAWICRNSYGPTWGRNGEFWIYEGEPSAALASSGELDPIDDVMMWVDGVEFAQ